MVYTQAIDLVNSWVKTPQTNSFADGMQPRLHGMLPVAHGEFQEVQQGAVHWPASLKQCAALCNSLSLVKKGVLVGDAADLAAFSACEATFLVRLAIHCKAYALSACKAAAHTHSHTRQMHSACQAFLLVRPADPNTLRFHCVLP